MATNTERLEVSIIICTTFALRLDVINMACRSCPTTPQTLLAQTVITTKNANTADIPVPTVTTIMPTAAMWIGKLADLLISLMLGAQARTITH